MTELFIFRLGGPTNEKRCKASLNNPAAHERLMADLLLSGLLGKLSRKERG